MNPGPTSGGDRPRLAALERVRSRPARRELAPNRDRCDPEQRCITCSDEALLVRVVGPDAGPGLAICADGRGSLGEVQTDLVGPVARGDSLLVHAGVALVRLEKETALAAGRAGEPLAEGHAGEPLTAVRERERVVHEIRG